MDALGVALDLIHKQVSTDSPYEKIEIFFFTAFESPFKSSARTIKAYVAALKSKKIELIFVGTNVTEELLENENNMTKGELVAYQIVQEVEFFSNEIFHLNLKYATFF